MQFAKLISFVFHPIIVPIASALLYFILVPNHIPKAFSYRVLGLIFITTYILPVILLFFLKKIKLIEDFYLNSINERKFPVTFFIVLSFLIGYLLLKFDIINLLAISFFACSLALVVVYILFFFKIKTSLHALAIAGQIGFISVISYEYKNNLLLLLIVLFLLFGVVATSRLQLKAHNLPEVVLGFFVGFLSQIFMYTYFIF
ncbi:hypothetical protein UMM65_12240 [Aureibaculum sp. 2210JD6-5]|uniref:hypothetical protein n=1 Tax=Aureibaculum sp. 2210JD6-5 TaxID=3103957 RepID=UPI002AAE0D46|nr:hypothetical protein [Aureibaculum sp. 2210JD6-5]MDY7396017.1 hypothetical protein [Aureibaculum sp. 2210JD6-5]